MYTISIVVLSIIFLISLYFVVTYNDNPQRKGEARGYVMACFAAAFALLMTIFRAW